MSIRTYLPFLKFLLLKTCAYIKRYEVQIRSHLPEGAAQTALTTALDACQALEVFVAAAIPPVS